MFTIYIKTIAKHFYEQFYQLTKIHNVSLKSSLIVTLQILVQIVPLEFSFLPMIFCDHLAFSKCRLNSSRIANQGRLFLSILVLELAQERDTYL